MIEIKELDYEIDRKKILKNITLTFEEQNFYAIIGPNGAGKSTLLKQVMGLIKPTRGTVTIDGKIHLTPKAYAKKCSFVFQENQRDVELSVSEVLSMGRYVYTSFLGDLSRKDKAIVETIARDLNIEHLLTQRVHTLSGGEAQKVFIARALIQQTPYVLLDEPTSMLDIHNSIALLEQLKVLQKKYQLTVVIVMHDLNLAAHYATHMVLLKEGEVALAGETQAVVADDRLKEAYHYKIKCIQDGATTYIVPNNDTTRE